jgi:hypothetical protein
MGKNGGKKQTSLPKETKKYHPFVSICTPTFNRRPFIQTMFHCFRNQTYPKSRMEWIIVDDGTDKIGDLVAAANIPQIQYFSLPEKLSLGAKRNYMHQKTKGSIIVYMDDDDYYPPERVEHAVERLMGNKQALCAGASELYIYFKHIQKMIQCGPYGPNHATAGTFAFKRELLDQTQYEDHAALAEEKAFLKNYTIPFVQLDSMKTILVFSHEHNTFDKRKLLDNMHPQYCKESNKTVDMFIRMSKEAPTKDFFMNQIDELLKVYEPGDPKMKPDVLVQMKKIEQERDEMIRRQREQQQQQQGQNPGSGQIIMQRPGEQPVVLTPEQIVSLVQNQQQQMQQATARIAELEGMVVLLQKQLLAASSVKVGPIAAQKSEPEVTVVV